MSVNIAWVERYGNADDIVRSVLEKFGDLGLIILDFLLPKCMTCSNNVHSRSLPCSRECLQKVNSIYSDHPLCLFPERLLPERKDKLMYIKNHKERKSIVLKHPYFKESDINNKSD